MRCGARCLDDGFSHVRGKPLQGGYLMGIQTPGRHGQYHPPLHGIAPSGGWQQEAQQGMPLASMPYPLWRQKWPWPLLTRLRQTVKTKELQGVVAACDRRYREGVVTNVHKGDVPSRSQSWATSLATYGVRPPLSLWRSDRYDGQRVPYPYRSHKSEPVARETVAVYTCIGSMSQQVFPKGLPRIRYDGVQATKTLATVQVLIQVALAKVQGIVKGAIQIIAPMTSRQRSQQSSGRDP